MNFKEKFLFIVLLLLSAGFSVYRLTESPPTWLDEGMITQLAINLAEYGVMGLQASPDNFASGAYVSSGFPLIFPLAAFFKIVGVGFLQARIFMLFWILLLVAFSYIYILRMYGWRAAFFAGLLLATFAPLYGNGKNVLGEVPGLVFFILFLLFLQRMEKEEFLSKPFLFFGAGLALGLFAATKVIFLLALGAFAVLMAGNRFFRGKPDIFKFPLRGLLIFGAGTILPLLIWFFTQFSFSDSFRDIFAFYRNPYQLENVSSVMATNFLRFFKELNPFYTAFIFGLWGVSLVLREREKGGEVSLSEKTAFIFSFFVLFFYLRTAGWYRYFFPAQIVTLIYFPAALFYLGAWGDRIFPEKSSLLKLLGTAVIAGLVIFQAYQVGFDSWVADSYQSTRSKELGAYFKAWDPVASLFIYNSPEVVTFLPRHSVYYQFLESNKRVILGQVELERISRERLADVVVLIADESGQYPLKFFPGYQVKDRINRYTILERE